MKKFVVCSLWFVVDCSEGKEGAGHIGLHGGGISHNIPALHRSPFLVAGLYGKRTLRTPGTPRAQEHNTPVTGLNYFTGICKTSTNYMGLKTYCEDYQPVAKKQGVNGIPPVSSWAGSLGCGARFLAANFPATGKERAPALNRG